MACATCTECVKKSSPKVTDESIIVSRSDSELTNCSFEYAHRGDGTPDNGGPGGARGNNAAAVSPSDFCESYIVQQALKEEQAKLKSTGDFDEVKVEERCFHLARTSALIGDKRTLKSLLSNDPWMLNAKDYTSGRPLLTYATLADKLNVIKWLIKQGAEVDVKDSIERTPLHWAVHKGYHGIVKLMLDHQADCTLTDAEGVSPLHLAIKQPSTKCLQTMLDHLASNKRRMDASKFIDAKGRTPLHWASALGCVDHVTSILRHKLRFDAAQGDADGRTPLMWAAWNNAADASLACCQTLIGKCPATIHDRDKFGFSALHYAVSANNVAVLQHLLRAKHCNANVFDNSYRTPLHWACKLNFTEIVDALLQRGAQINLKDAAGATPLHYAAQENHARLVEKLFLTLDGKLDVLNFDDGKTALMYAAGSGANSVIEIMLRLFQDKNQKDYNGSTALHLAAQSGQPSTLQLLIKSGWHPETSDNHGLTPLLSAAEAGHAQCVQMLLKSGANIGHKDKNGRTALHWAALGGHAYVCQLLVKQGLNADFPDAGGRTPLHCAAFAGHHECVSVLVQAGADVYAVDNETFTPLHSACQEGQLKCSKMLLDAGAALNAVCADADAEDDRPLTPLDLALQQQQSVAVDKNRLQYVDVNGNLVDYLIACGGLTYESLTHVAASKIQAYYRGYVIRKLFRCTKSFGGVSAERQNRTNKK